MTAAARGWAALIVGVLGVASLAATAYAIHDAGRMQERAVWQQKEALRAARIADELRAEYERGRAASTKYQLGASALQSRYFSLEGPARDVRRRIALVLPPRPIGDRDVQQAPEHLSPAAPAVDVQQDARDGPPRLSLAAVWMWNSALAGADAPAGACGLADTSSEACAADAGLTLDDAWTNHEINARSCAADRLRHRALIEFLTERPAR